MCVQEGPAEAWVLNSECSRPPLESYGHQGPPICCFNLSSLCWLTGLPSPHTGALGVLQDNPGGEICSRTWEPRGTQTSVRKTADTPVRYEFHLLHTRLQPQDLQAAVGTRARPQWHTVQRGLLCCSLLSQKKRTPLAPRSQERKIKHRVLPIPLSCPFV